MNIFTGLAQIEAAPTLKNSGDKQLAIFQISIPPYKEDDPAIILQASAWGQLANDLSDIDPGSWANITGRLRLEKDRQPEIQIGKFHRVAPSELPGLNQITLVGRAGRDPEVRYFESGSVVANLTLAVNRRSRDDEPDWFNLAIWGKQAQVAADYVRKGTLLAIAGSLGQERWTDRTSGEERSKLLIRVDRFDLLGSRRDAEPASGDGGDF